MPLYTQYDHFQHLSSLETDDCILWPYRQNEKGYGTINRSGHETRTHRLSLKKATGLNPPPTTFALHSCPNRHCLNPRHLRWGTPAENAADRIKDGNQQRGTDHGRAILTEQDVLEIRSGSISIRKAAEKFGVGKTTVLLAKKGETWKHLPMPATVSA